jgi:hypothetical protein
MSNVHAGSEDEQAVGNPNWANVLTRAINVSILGIDECSICTKKLAFLCCQLLHNSKTKSGD